MVLELHRNIHLGEVKFNTMKKTNMHIQSGDRKLHSVLIQPDNKHNKKHPAVLFIHGMTSSNNGYVEIAEKIANLGIIGLAVSLSGHGQSTGNFEKLTVKDLTQDGLSAFKTMTNLPTVDKTRIGALGTSVGAHIVTTISQKHPIKSIVIRVPAIYSYEMENMRLLQIMKKEEQIFSELKNHTQETSAIQSISKFQGNLLVVTSENDQVIPSYVSNAYVDNANQANIVKHYQIANAPHVLSQKNWRNEFVEETIEWFKKTL